ncbi:MAG: hypothetical protein PHP31_02285, partial [Lentimicrobiaceae bacterium]|nr:hypothetical protein [Lentimicrobiaceae bacterium]
MQTPKKLTVKRVVLSLIYALIIYLVGLTLYVSISIHTCMVLYDYKESIYQQELNFLFRKEVLPTLGAKYVYKYKNKAGIYFMEQNGNNITIVECSNFKNIDLENVQIIENVEIESTNRITYVQYYHPPFAAVQQASKPKKSSYLNVVIDNKDPIPMKSIGKK